jgi:guanylate kinase
MKKIIQVCLIAPSGGGKGTLKRLLLALKEDLFIESISGASRLPRGDEKNGIDYYFRTPEQFKQDINDGKFAEWEMVYEGKYYGTYIFELQRIADLGKVALLDIDYKGAHSIAELYSDSTLIIGILPPSLEVLEERLRARETDTEDAIKERLARAKEEITIIQQLDHIIINNTPEQMFADALKILKQHGLVKNYNI